MFGMPELDNLLPHFLFINYKCGLIYLRNNNTIVISSHFYFLSLLYQYLSTQACLSVSYL